ncbi:MAG: hypothetical protein Q9216_004898 [Gyalolechia sp. 2 TL-2023]
MATEASNLRPTVANGNREPIKLHISKSTHRAPRLLIIGAGARGNAYARAVSESTNACVYAVADPIQQKREALGRKYIWRHEDPVKGQIFCDWREFLEYERLRRQRRNEGDSVGPGVDGVFICTLDEMHAEIITGLAPLNLHMMSEKPLATTLKDCLDIYKSLQAPQDESPRALFSIGHVLHYSPHNMLLRKLLLDDRVIGEILSIEHTEPVGWWHFSHSYVRGNWRKESTTAPSLLTKSCHDIDFLLWLLCSPLPGSETPRHLPTHIGSMGSLKYFKRSRKPGLAGDATNCVSCPAEKECIYSAKKIYEEKFLKSGNAGWPVHIVDPEIEDLVGTKGMQWAIERLRSRLAEDYDTRTLKEHVESRPWFGRCVYESDNDVCDDQIVTMSWDDDPLPRGQHLSMGARLKGRGAKTAVFHMIAQTEKQCERRGRVYGSRGEIEYDSKMIRVYNFATSKAEVHYPHQPGGGHGGGDDGLTRHFINAIEAVEQEATPIKEAQLRHIGCTLEDVIRSHAMVFAAEEARRTKMVIDWADWWHENVDSQLDSDRRAQASDFLQDAVTMSSVFSHQISNVVQAGYMTEDSLIANHRVGDEILASDGALVVKDVRDVESTEDEEKAWLDSANGNASFPLTPATRRSLSTTTSPLPSPPHHGRQRLLLIVRRQSRNDHGSTLV